jgi:hypothetical protein
VDVEWFVNDGEPGQVSGDQGDHKIGVSGGLFNGATGVPHGGRELGGCNLGEVGIKGASITVAWPSGGCGKQDATSNDHNMLAEMSWYTNGYSGNWWAYVRSPVAHAADKHNFRFTTNIEIPGDSTGAGYDA